MRHETVVTSVPLAELEKVLSVRALLRWDERHPGGVAIYDGDSEVITGYRGQATQQEHEGSVKALVEGYRAEGLAEDTAWSATCKCGWSANNPLPTKVAAEVDAEAHITAIYGEA